MLTGATIVSLFESRSIAAGSLIRFYTGVFHLLSSLRSLNESLFASDLFGLVALIKKGLTSFYRGKPKPGTEPDA